MSKQDLIIFGDGLSTRDYLDVDDLCNGILSAIQKDILGFQKFHLSSGAELSVNDLAKYVIDTCPFPNRTQIKYLNKRPGEVERNFANYHKAKKILNFNPEHSIKDSLITTWKWFKDYSKNHKLTKLSI